MGKIKPHFLFPGLYALFSLITLTIFTDIQSRSPDAHAKGFFWSFFEEDIESGNAVKKAAWESSQTGYKECMHGNFFIREIHEYRNESQERYYEALDAGMECRASNPIWTQPPTYKVSISKIIGNYLVLGLIPALTLWLVMYNYRRREENSV